MAAKESIRPGGRSARVQASVHQAVRDLLAGRDRAELTIPMIAAQAGVTPSTIYRRWGDLAELLADVALERMRPDSPPADTGDVRSDLEAWLEQYVDEMASGPGRAMLRDVLAGSADGKGLGQCSAYTCAQMAVIAERAVQRGQTPPDVEAILDQVIAPVIYRILFTAEPPGPAYCRSLIERVLSGRR